MVVGGGQAGLSVGHQLARRGLPFVILDANERIGDAWRNRWDSLRLFSPNHWNGLPGMPFPAPAHTYPTKDETADYLEAYAARFELPVRTGVTVDRLSKEGNRFVVASGDLRFEAENVVAAMATHQIPRVPQFASELDPGIVQLHSSEYRNPSQLRDGGVLVVGAGNSGAEIALEVSTGHPTWLSGRHPGHVPLLRIDSIAARFVVLRLAGLFSHRVLTINTPPGRKWRSKLLSGGTPLGWLRPTDIAAAGIERVPRVMGTRDGLPVLDDQRVLEVVNVIWCTGFNLGFTWIDLPVFDENGRPIHERGIVVQEPGLYFVGLLFLYALSSGLLLGVGRDAAHVVKDIASRTR